MKFTSYKWRNHSNQNSLNIRPRKDNPANATRDATMSIVPTSLKTYCVKLYRFDKS